VRTSGVVDHPALDAQSILVVEEQPYLARDLQAALEEADAEVVVARDTAEALARIARFDFSAAALYWRPDSSEQLTVGIRFLFCATEPPEDVRTARGAPIFVKPTLPEEIVKALALLIGADNAKNTPHWW
jgi:hypothetical protein